MSPDFGGAVARGMIDGALGLLSQPVVVVTLIVIVAVSVISGRRRRRGR